MIAYWHDAFPPAHPLKFLVWFTKTHVGNLFAYPAGGKNGASTGSLILFVIGLLALRGKMPSGMAATPRRFWFSLFLTPFVLTFIAAALRRYPYGESARVSQHLAPVIILLMGMGISAAVQRLAKTEKGQRQAVRGILFAIMIVGAIGLVDNIIHPYKTKDDYVARQLIHEPIWKVASNQDLIVVLQPFSSLWPNYQWYLSEKGERVVLYDAIHNLGQLHELITLGKNPLWILSLRESASDTQELFRWLPDHQRLEPGPYYLQLGPRQGPKAYFQAYYVGERKILAGPTSTQPQPRP